MRTSRLLAPVFVLLAALAGGCDAEPPAPETEGDPAVARDDEEVVRRVLHAALVGRPELLSELELPPRVSRVRVAERALHDTLLARRRRTPEFAPLLDALDGLAQAQGGADADALAPLVAAWRAWTPAQIDAERQGSRQMALATAALDQPQPPPPEGLRKLVEGETTLPPGSLSRAGLTFVDFASLALEEGPQPKTPATKALRRSIEAFEELRWPGGLAGLADPLAAHLLRARPNGERAEALWRLAVRSYTRSGDLVRAGRMHLDRAMMVQRAGDPLRAYDLAERGRKLIEDSGAVGRERFDALALFATMSQAAGQHAAAVEAATAALAGADEWRVPTETLIPTGSVLAVSLFQTGQSVEALRVAREIAARYDAEVTTEDTSLRQLRASLDETAAEAALAAERPAEAIQLLTDAERRYAAIGERDDVRPADMQAYSRLLLARAHFAAGDERAGRQQVRDATRRKLSPAVLALATNVLIDGAGGKPGPALDDAADILEQVEAALGPGGRGAVIELRGRVLAARGETSLARQCFAQALDRITGGEQGAFGQQAVRVLLWSADMEEGLGELRRARDDLIAAQRHLGESAPPREVDRVRRRVVDLYRRLGWSVDALPWARRRVESGPPGEAAERAAAKLDLFLILLDLAVSSAPERGAEYAQEAREVAESMAPERAAVCSEALGRLYHRDAGLARAPAPDDERLAVLHGLVGTLASAEPQNLVGAALDLLRVDDLDPEVRRLAAAAALRYAVEGKRTEDVLRLIELRRHDRDASLWTLQSALAPGEVFVAVEPCGTFTAVVTATRDAASHRKVDGMGGIDAFWDATRVEPSAEALVVGAATAAIMVLADVTFGDAPVALAISLGHPLGPLPWDLLPVGDRQLVAAATVTTVASAAERAQAWDRSAPPAPPPLPDRFDPLRHRHAFVQVVALYPEEHARIVELYRAARAKHAPSEALRQAKLTYRTEWTLPQDSLPRVPAWTGLTLRGAP